MHKNLDNRCNLRYDFVIKMNEAKSSIFFVKFARQAKNMNITAIISTFILSGRGSRQCQTTPDNAEICISSILTDAYKQNGMSFCDKMWHFVTQPKFEERIFMARSAIHIPYPILAVSF